MMGVAPQVSNRATRLRYPDDYYCTIRIAKAEKDPMEMHLEYLQCIFFRMHIHIK